MVLSSKSPSSNSEGEPHVHDFVHGKSVNRAATFIRVQMNVTGRKFRRNSLRVRRLRGGGGV